ncbi:MAG: dipeptidase [Planctomycetes bacterium]|nr:dipeptidase [Planctomycetota bacterium]
MSVNEQVTAYLDANKNANVDRLLDFLRIPSISTDPTHKKDLQTGAEWVNALFVGCGIKSEIVETPGHACVLADSGPADNGGPTILVYGHYDVQPTGDESLWHSPAFEPTIRDGVIYARGAADDKGQVFTHMLAAEAWMKTVGKLPIRVKFMIEGEEEVGSTNLEKLVRDRKDWLACDYVVLSDTPKFDTTTPAITYGTKGMVYKEIIVTGPKQNLHSGSFGGTLTNPGNALVGIIAAMRDDKNRVTIPGFYDDVRAIGDDERKQMNALPFDEAAYLAAMGAPSLHGEEGYTTIERRWARPTLDVNGMIGGFTGEGASTVIPAKVSAKVSMRLVPDQDHVKIAQAFEDFVRAAAPPGVGIEILDHTGCGPYVCPLDSPGMAAAADAVEAGYGQRPLFTREGGSLPILPLFKDVLGADSLMIGFCDPNCNAHGPNEFFAVSDLHAGAKTAAHLLARMAEAS